MHHNPHKKLLLYLMESIAIDIDPSKAQGWMSRIESLIPEDCDVSKVPNQFLAWLLINPTHGVYQGIKDPRILEMGLRLDEGVRDTSYFFQVRTESYRELNSCEWNAKSSIEKLSAYILYWVASCVWADQPRAIAISALHVSRLDVPGANRFEITPERRSRRIIQGQALIRMIQKACR